MAGYNRWQNENLYGAAEALSDEERKAQRGAFFGSIHGTLNHLLWADQMWMSRFAGTPRPKADGIPNSLDMYESWDDLKRERAALRRGHHRLGREARSSLAARRTDLVFGCGRARGDEAQGPAGHAYVQPPDAPPRPGALHADPVRGEAGRYGFAVPATRDGQPVRAGHPTLSRSSPARLGRDARQSRIAKSAGHTRMPSLGRAGVLQSGQRASRTEEAPWTSA